MTLPIDVKPNPPNKEETCVAFFPEAEMNPEREVKVIYGYENIKEYVEKYRGKQNSNSQ